MAPEQGRPPDAPAYALAPTIAALSLVRRRWPLAVLLGSAAALFVYNQFDYPGLFSAVPLSVALATAWAAGHRSTRPVGRWPSASASTPAWWWPG